MCNLNKSIPVFSGRIDAASYKDIAISLDAPEGKEPLVMLKDYGIACESFYARHDGKNRPYCRSIEGALDDVWLRQGVAEKLCNVNRRLEKFNVEVFVFNGYRPIECQRGLWRYFSEKIAKDNPNLNDHEKYKLVIQFVSDPTQFSLSDYRTWPTHSSGGAVDLGLHCKESGALLDMGSAFDEMSEISYTVAYEVKLAKSEITQKDHRLINRRILYNSMILEGFTNYPQEYWHFDFGNQMHTFISQSLKRADAPCMAVYGYIEPPRKPS